MAGQSNFLRALAAVLFLAVCAYLGAAVFSKTEQAISTVKVRPETVSDSAELEGVAIRREQLLYADSSALILARDGERLPAEGKLARLADGQELNTPGSVMFYSDFDGLEWLSPDGLEPLAVEDVKKLMSAQPSSTAGAVGRLVSGHCWYYAAITKAAFTISEQHRCRLIFDGEQEALSALIVSVSEPSADGRRAILFRLDRLDDVLMRLRVTEAVAVISEYSGLMLPYTALEKAEDGESYVYTVTSGRLERRQVKPLCIYGSSVIVESVESVGALREGSTVITNAVDGHDAYR